MPLVSPSFPFNRNPFGDDELWTVQQPIGPDNLTAFIRNPEEWVRKFQESGQDLVVIPSPFTIHVHVRTWGVPKDHMFIQGIGGTNVMNLYMPRSISETLVLTPPANPNADITERGHVLFVLEYRPEDAGRRRLKGKVFLHYQVFEPTADPRVDDAFGRAYALANFHLDLARNYNLTAVGEREFAHSTKAAKCRNGNVLDDYGYDSKKIPADFFWTPKYTQAAIHSENDATRVACEILVAQYKAGEITWEEAYTKAYAEAGP